MTSTPSRTGIRKSRSVTLGRCLRHNSAAFRPSVADATTNMSSSMSMIEVKPAKKVQWSSAIRTPMLLARDFAMPTAARRLVEREVADFDVRFMACLLVENLRSKESQSNSAYHYRPWSQSRTGLPFVGLSPLYPGFRILHLFFPGQIRDRCLES